jgi:hypothetical protein
MPCEWCGTIFCWDNADEAGGTVRKCHCSEECRKLHEQDRYRRRKRRERCQGGTIRRFGTQREARQAAGRLAAATGGRFRAYDRPCAFCGDWHVARKPPAGHRPPSTRQRPRRIPPRPPEGQTWPRTSGSG